MDQGNYKDAYDGLRKIILEPGQPIDSDLDRAVQCLERLNRTEEVDELLESALKAQAGDPHRWWFTWDVARNYQQIPKQGFIVAGKFYRGQQRGGGGMSTLSTATASGLYNLWCRRMPAPGKTKTVPSGPVLVVDGRHAL